MIQEHPAKGKNLFTRNFLVEMRRKALRRGVWFEGLDRVERSILSLAAHVVDCVKSDVLGVVLVRILNKLRNALKSEFVRRMDEYGLRRAWEVAGQALEWGNGAAGSWASDSGFVRYLTLMDMYGPSGFGV